MQDLAGAGIDHEFPHEPIGIGDDAVAGTIGDASARADDDAEGDEAVYPRRYRQMFQAFAPRRTPADSPLADRCEGGHRRLR